MSRDGRLLNREEEDESFEDGGVELGYARIPGEDGLSGNEERTRSSEEREEGSPRRDREGAELGYARIPGEEDREEGSSFRIAGRSSRGGEEKERLARSARRDGEEDREG